MGFFNRKNRYAKHRTLNNCDLVNGDVVCYTTLPRASELENQTPRTLLVGYDKLSAGHDDPDKVFHAYISPVTLEIEMVSFSYPSAQENFLSGLCLEQFIVYPDFMPKFLIYHQCDAEYYNAFSNKFKFHAAGILFDRKRKTWPFERFAHGPNFFAPIAQR